MPLNRKGGPWEGGYVSLGANARETFVIEREVGGIRFHVSTRTHSRRAALKQLERFESNPLAYRPEGEERGQPLRLTAALVEEHRDFSLARGNTTKHAAEMRRLLADWIEDLAGRDLRSLSAVDLRRALAGRKTSQPHRIIAIKSFCSWLRVERGLLRTAEDPTLDLPVPQSTPEKWRRRKAVPFVNVQAALAELTEEYRDALTFMAASGWHVTELERFVRAKDSELLPVGRDGVLAVAVVRHKSGELHRYSVRSEEVLEAATRMRQRRAVPRRLNASLREACAAADVPSFTFGVMRHSVATWAVEAGAHPRDVSEFLGHKDPKTTARFYTDVAVPPSSVPVPPLRLVKG